jgi:hypothetical protein
MHQSPLKDTFMRLTPSWVTDQVGGVKE